MRFSILLPTRNGGEYLSDAIASALQQPYGDMEVVVSDNASDSSTAAVVSRFASDPRLKYVRLDRVVSVTENWNSALRASTGDYLLMIGDDDCLMPTFFEAAAAAIERHRRPDCITFNGFTFMFPGSLPGQPSAWFSERHFRFGPEFSPDSEMPRVFRKRIVEDMFRFRVRFPLNMQLTLFSRGAASLLHGDLFRPPFPDHYALNSMLLLADRFVYVPDRLVVVGVSPKSFGHYYYGGQQREGQAYLGLTAPDDGRLPGSDLLNFMREWLHLLKRDYAAYLEGTEVSRWNYAGRQVYHWTRDFEFGQLTLSELLRRAAELSWSERLMFFAPLFAYRTALSGLRFARVRQRTRFQEMLPALQPVPGVASILEFAAKAARNS